MVEVRGRRQGVSRELAEGKGSGQNLLARAKENRCLSKLRGKAYL